MLRHPANLSQPPRHRRDESVRALLLAALAPAHLAAAVRPLVLRGRGRRGRAPHARARRGRRRRDGREEGRGHMRHGEVVRRAVGLGAGHWCGHAAHGLGGGRRAPGGRAAGEALDEGGLAEG